MCLYIKVIVTHGIRKTNYFLARDLFQSEDLRTYFRWTLWSVKVLFKEALWAH
jgi:hypothetical protein